MKSSTQKPLDQQVIVITGASSGIGLATAEKAAQSGAKVVLAARSEQILEELAGRINRDGGNVLAVGCDVADRQQLEHVANVAIQQFGRIDTWVNNAGVSIYGRLDEVNEEDSRRLFDTNFWGVCHGSLTALRHLRQSGGTLINIGSEVSEGVMPFQGMYSASKHAVKGFTDALRIEIEDIDQAPVTITLIQPTAVDTPYPQHAKNYTDKEAKLPPPMIDPEKVADAILEAAVHPIRDKRVGMLSKVNTTIAKIAPGIGDKMATKRAGQQFGDDPPFDPDGALHKPSQESSVVGQAHGIGAQGAD